MADSSWDTYTPERRPFGRLGGRLLTALAVVATAITLLVVALVSMARSQRGGAWVLARNVATALGSDNGARELYRRNPALALAYPDEESFLAKARGHRAGLRLPAAEPAEGPEYRFSTGPFRLWVQVRCEGGTWIDAVAETGGPFRPRPPGDGITRVLLAQDRAEIRQQFRAMADRRAAALWRRFIAVARELAREGGAEALRREDPALRILPAEPRTFAELAQRRREALLALPDDPTAKGPFQTRRRSGPFGSHHEVGASLQDGGQLRAVWRDDRLTEVELR